MHVSCFLFSFVSQSFKDTIHAYWFITVFLLFLNWSLFLYASLLPLLQQFQHFIYSSWILNSSFIHIHMPCLLTGQQAPQNRDKVFSFFFHKFKSLGSSGHEDSKNNSQPREFRFHIKCLLSSLTWNLPGCGPRKAI